LEVEADIAIRSKIAHDADMKQIALLLLFLATGCAPAEQPESNKTVAAYEVALNSDEDYRRFLSILNQVGESEGYLLYHRDGGGVQPFTLNASIWRGDFEESMVHAMDFEDRVGRVWITFPLGKDPARSESFRNALMLQIIERWPSTASLPIMPNGAIPLTRDLIRTQEGYQVREEAAPKYADHES
jgi:hypothetical protein